MKAIRTFLKSDFFMAACGLIGCCLYAEIHGGSDKLVAIFAITQIRNCTIRLVLTYAISFLKLK